MIYWAIFTLGFLFGAVFSFVTFAAKDMDEEASLPESKKSAGVQILIRVLSRLLPL